MRVVLDTNVLARAASGPPGLGYALVLACTRFPHELLLSPFIVSELSRVLRYDRVRSSHGLTDEEIDKHVADLQLVANMVIPTATQPIVSLDPDDDVVVATAVQGKADVLCTLDRDLFTRQVLDYCRACGVEVLTDRELMERLKH